MLSSARPVAKRCCALMELARHRFLSTTEIQAVAKAGIPSLVVMMMMMGMMLKK